MKTRGVLLILAGVALGLVVYEGGATAREQVRGRADQSKQLLSLKRKINRLRQRSISYESPRAECSPDAATECWAKSESEAREKLLELAELQERELASQMDPTGTSEIDPNPEHMSSVLCEDGVSEAEKVAIATELSSRYKWAVHVQRIRAPKDSDFSQEAQHQVIKKHLGEQRYIDQVIKCRKLDASQEERRRELGQEQLGEILGLSDTQRSRVKELFAKRYALQYGVDRYVPVLDDTGHMVDVELQAPDVASVQYDTPADSEAEYARRELELSESFFSLLTPEQARRYQRLLEDQGEAIQFLSIMRFDPPETPRKSALEGASASQTTEHVN